MPNTSPIKGKQAIAAVTAGADVAFAVAVTAAAAAAAETELQANSERMPCMAKAEYKLST